LRRRLRRGWNTGRGRKTKKSNSLWHETHLWFGPAVFLKNLLCHNLMAMGIVDKILPF
jgi:hypothetical protein